MFTWSACSSSHSRRCLCTAEELAKHVDVNQLPQGRLKAALFVVLALQKLVIEHSPEWIYLCFDGSPSVGKLHHELKVDSRRYEGVFCGFAVRDLHGVAPYQAASKPHWHIFAGKLPHPTPAMRTRQASSDLQEILEAVSAWRPRLGEDGPLITVITVHPNVKVR